MPLTQEQQQNLTVLQERLDRLMRDLVEEEYHSLLESSQTRGAKFFKDGVTAKEVSDEMILQWSQGEWSGNWIVASINPTQIIPDVLDLTGAAQRGPWISIFGDWEKNLKDFKEFSIEDAREFLEAIEIAAEAIENGEVAFYWNQEKGNGNIIHWVKL